MRVNAAVCIPARRAIATSPFTVSDGSGTRSDDSPIQR